MNDDEERDVPDTFLIDNDPAKMLPFSKRLVPEDPDANRRACKEPTRQKDPLWPILVYATGCSILRPYPRPTSCWSC